MIWAVLILVVLLIVFVFSTINLLQKYERLEKVNSDYEQFFLSLKEASESIFSQLRAIDIRGSFENDDEVGIVYKGISGLTRQLEKFFEEGVNEETK